MLPDTGEEPNQNNHVFNEETEQDVSSLGGLSFRASVVSNFLQSTTFSSFFYLKSSTMKKILKLYCSLQVNVVKVLLESPTGIHAA